MGATAVKGGPVTDRLWRHYRRGGNTPVIPDIKLRSPGEGDLLRGRDPVALAVELAEAGAPALSVVTEGEHFGGSLALLERIAGATSLPVLRKDFITTKAQLAASRAAGAEAVLLIAAMLTPERLLELYKAALALDLEPLVETHRRKEVELAQGLGVSFLGINNRNIVELELDDGHVGRTEKLAALAPAGAFVLSESGIASRAEVERALAAGAHGVLVGTAILQAPDPVHMYHLLCQSGG